MDAKFADYALTGAEGAVTIKKETVTAVAGKGSSDTAVAGQNGAFVTVGQNATLNGKTVTITRNAVGNDTLSAVVDADGNLTIGLANNADVSDEAKLKAAIDAAFAAASKGTGATDAMVTAWQAAKFTAGTGGTHAAPADGAAVGTFTIGEGATGAARVSPGEKITVTAGTGANAKTGTVTVTGNLADNTSLTFTGDITGTLKVVDNTAVTAGGATIGTAPINGGVADTSLRVDCPAYDVKNAQGAADGQRAGIVFRLNADMIAEGNTLTIEDLTVKFVAKGKGSGTNGAADTTKNEIELDYTTGTAADRLAKVTEFLSSKSSTNFNIGRSTSTSAIEIEEKVPGTGASYKNYSLADLKGMFTLKTPARAATNVLKVTNGNIVSGDTIRIGDHAYTFVKEGKGSGTNGVPGEGEVLIGADTKATMNNLKAKIVADGDYNAVVEDNGDLTLSNLDAKKPAPFVIGGGLTLQIGDTADAFNKMNVAVANMGTKGLGIANLDITSESKASAAIDKVKAAINTVSTARAGMGALQNRLEHTINNLDVAVENLSSANSRIRDTDMAKEMMNYTKMNVLVQSAQAMLAQANQQPQSVLQLLQ